MGAMSDIAADAARLGIGGNNPPEPTPFDGFSVHVNDLYEEAKNFLDGEAISSEGQAEAVAALLSQLRTAAKDADKARATEKKPYDDAAKAVQARWKPLLDRCDLATDAAKKALVPWLQKLEADQRAAAESARREAEEKANAAAEAARVTAANDIGAREETERLIKDADNAAKVAKQAEKTKAHATGGARAVGLRSYYSPTLIDPVEALKHYRSTRPAELRAFLTRLAETDVNNGSRSIPGFEIIEERRAV